MVWGYHPRRLVVRGRCPLNSCLAVAVSAVVIVMVMAKKRDCISRYFPATFARVGSLRCARGRTPLPASFSPPALPRILSECFRFRIADYRRWLPRSSSD